MIDLAPKLFLVPITVLGVVLIGYTTLSKRTSNRILFRKFIFILTTIGFLLNFIWEILHSPLYQGYINNMQHALISALASVADALMVHLLYVGFSFIFKNPYWIQTLTVQRAILVAILGGAGAILSEVIHVSGGDWVYAAAMPILPIVNVGLSPVFQFITLPLSSYCFSFYLLKFGNDPNTIY